MLWYENCRLFEVIMNKYSLSVILSFLMIGQVFAQTQLHDSDDMMLKNDVVDFQKIVILSAVLDQCKSNFITHKKKTELKPFTKSYSNYLIEKINLTQNEVLKIVADSLYRIDMKYGDEIPITVCLNALELTEKIKNQFENVNKVSQK